MPSISESASGALESYQPIVLNAPPSFTQCIPENVTWAGGAAPYSLLVKFQNSNVTPAGFNNINTTYFLWTPNVPAGTPVLLELIDKLGSLDYTLAPILVTAAAPGVECSIVGTETPSRSTSTSAIPASTHTTPQPLSSYSPVPLRRLRASIMALITTEIVFVFVSLAILFWWRARRVVTRKRGHRLGNYGMYPRQVVDRRNDNDSYASIAERRWRGDQWESILTTDTIPPAPDNEILTHARSSLPDSPSSSLSAVDNSVVARASIQKAALGLERTAYTSMQSNSDTQMLSDMGTTQLSITTSYTLPPSYRTHHSAGNISIQLPDYSSFPPPVYTPQGTNVPTIPTMF